MLHFASLFVGKLSNMIIVRSVRPVHRDLSSEKFLTKGPLGWRIKIEKGQHTYKNICVKHSDNKLTGQVPPEGAVQAQHCMTKTKPNLREHREYKRSDSTVTQVFILFYI